MPKVLDIRERIRKEKECEKIVGIGWEEECSVLDEVADILNESPPWSKNRYKTKAYEISKTFSRDPDGDFYKVELLENKFFKPKKYAELVAVMKSRSVQTADKERSSQAIPRWRFYYDEEPMIRVYSKEVLDIIIDVAKENEDIARKEGNSLEYQIETY